MSAIRIWDRFKNLLDVNWASISDGQFLKRSGSNIVGATSAGTPDNVLIGDTAQGTYPATSIIVPSFKAHPDAVFSGGTSALDDHFEGSTLNAKWTVTTDAGLDAPTVQVAGSKLSLGARSPNYNNSVTYFNYVTTPLPNNNSFTVTIRLDTSLSAYMTSTSVATGELRLMNTAVGYGVSFMLTTFYSAVPQIVWPSIRIDAGLNAVTNQHWSGGSAHPKYLRIVYNSTTYETAFWYSMDGFVFQELWRVSGSSSGFSASAKPDVLQLMTSFCNYAHGLMQIDWVKFTNP